MFNKILNRVQDDVFSSFRRSLNTEPIALVVGVIQILNQVQDDQISSSG